MLKKDVIQTGSREAGGLEADILDVLIIGGGPVGACAGALLLRGAAGTARPLRVAVLEPKAAADAVGDEPIDSRVVAVARSSERILEAAGAWTRINGRVGDARAVANDAAMSATASRVGPYQRMRIWHENVSPLSAGALVLMRPTSVSPIWGTSLRTACCRRRCSMPSSTVEGVLRRHSSLGLPSARSM